MTVAPEIPAYQRPLDAPAQVRAQSWGAEAARRALDVAVAALALIGTAPLIAAIAVLVRATSPGPAIFRQVRVGRNGREFVFYKFRGMYIDARGRWPELYEYRYTDAELESTCFHAENDPRVTAAGRWIRRLSVDELPNFVNVLKGEMSLVGPRPEIPELIPYYGRHAETVLSVKPGVTSLPKVTGRDELTIAETLRLELEYLRRRSLWLDLKILAATVLTVVRRQGVVPG